MDGLMQPRPLTIAILKVLVVEKAHRIGGTSATSGGVTWIPNHGLGTSDSREEALTYIKAVANGPIRQAPHPVADRSLTSPG